MRAAVCAIVLALGCDRGHPTKQAPPPRAVVEPAPGSAVTPATTCNLVPIPTRLPPAKRIVAIGDIHGDLHAARAALRTAGAIDAEDRWIGGALVVVQTGDILDRGDDEQAILDLMYRLESEAKAAGGALIMLIGNHELMNAAGDFRYVTPGAQHDFDEAGGSRRVALGPGGAYAKKIGAHNVIAIVGDTVFSHGGVLGEWVTHVDEVNLSSRCWLDGQAGGPEAAPPSLTSDDSPVWSRAAAMGDVDCAKVVAALTALGVKRMVIGHTVQEHGISSACDGRVWRIDVGLAKVYGGPIEVLELAPDASPKVLTGTR
jgi:hypothetical protein